SIAVSSEGGALDLPPRGPDSTREEDPVPPQAAELLGHWDALCRSARKVMRDPSDAEDLAHDTFERALRALDRFTPGSNMRAWMYTIMVRLARDRFRRQRARRRDELDLDSLPAPSEEPAPAW